MEQDTKKRLDNVLEDELRLGFRLKYLPPTLAESLVATGGTPITRVRFSRLNPSRRRKISELVQRQYHKDLRDPDILSHEQILKLVSDRGEWSKAMDDEMERLRDETGKSMGELYANGLVNSEWGVELLDLSALFRQKIMTCLPDVDAQHQMVRIFDRWAEFSKERQDDYTARYAEGQSREAYSADVDMQRLLVVVAGDSEASEMLYQIDELRDRLHKFFLLQKDRVRLSTLQLKHLKIFSESVEQRRDNAEEMARLYFTTECVDESGLPTGALTVQFQDLWEFPEDVVQWLLLEAYFFLNGIPDAAREYLETFGFLKADQANETNPSPDGESAPSDGLPGPLTSNSATEVPAVTAVESSDASVLTISTTDSSPS
jgi:hypothetical protein